MTQIKTVHHQKSAKKKKLKVAVLAESKQRERLFRNFYFPLYSFVSWKEKDFKSISNQSPELIKADLSSSRITSSTTYIYIGGLQLSSFNKI